MGRKGKGAHDHISQRLMATDRSMGGVVPCYRQKGNEAAAGVTRIPGVSQARERDDAITETGSRQRRIDVAACLVFGGGSVRGPGSHRNRQNTAPDDPIATSPHGGIHRQ